MSNIVNALGYGAMVAVVGLLIVFLGLTILIVCITVMAKIFDAIKARKAQKAAAAAPAPAPAIEETAEEEDEGELIAVIAAAVAAAMEAEGEEEPTGFVVRSIRRINNAPAWNRAGREEQVYSRM